MKKQQKAANRILSFEVLRVLSMFMVILLHFVSQSASLAIPGTAMTPTRVAGGLVESFCIVAVDVYVLISGYFLCEAPYKLERLVRLLCEILFYTLLIPLVLHLAGVAIYGQDLWTAADYFLPISMNHYWFATSYVLLYLFAPVLNLAVRHMSRQQLKLTILCLLFFFCFLKSISPVQLVIDNAGYDFGWFLVLYLIAAYLRRFGTHLFQIKPAGENNRRHRKFFGMAPAKRAGFCYITSCLLIFVLYVALHMVNEKTGQLQYYSTVPFHYNSLLCLTGAVGLFEVFCLLGEKEQAARNTRLAETGRQGIRHGRRENKQQSEQEISAAKTRTGKAGWLAGLIRRVAPLTFGVYLIHQHVDIRDRWYPWLAQLFGDVGQNAPLTFLVRALLESLLLYVVCLLIDAIRQRLFHALTPLAAKTHFAAWCRKADEIFSAL